MSVENITAGKLGTPTSRNRMVGDSALIFQNITLCCRANRIVGDSASTFANKLFCCRSNGMVGGGAPTFANKL